MAARQAGAGADTAGSRPPIVFSHANGFPAGTYRSLFEIWRAAGHEVHAVQRYGHDPRFPVTNNWPHLRDELLHFLTEKVGRPAYLVGHSLGGYVSVLAAARRPDLALGLVLLDSPILAGWKARALQLAKASGIGERLSPAHVSKRRREQWPSAEAAYEHFAAKPLFARWAPGVLRDYIACGTRPQGDHGESVEGENAKGDGAPAGGPEGDGAARVTGRRLAFERSIETAIYRSLPHHFPRLLRRHPLQCPLAFIKGSESVEVRRVGLAATESLAHGRIATIAGSHLFPFEKPRETAREVLGWIEVFCTASAAA